MVHMLCFLLCHWFDLTIVTVLPLVVTNPNIAAATQSLASRTVLFLLLSLPKIPPASLYANQNVHAQILHRLRVLGAELSSTGLLSQSLSLVIGSSDLVCLCLPTSKS